MIDVPDAFTGDELDRARRSGDPALLDALDAAADAGAWEVLTAGSVTQYLAGVPDLLNHYQGPGADPYGQAVITAAMDAARLGYPGPYPVVFLQNAATGYMSDSRRAAASDHWQADALRYAARKLKGTICAVTAVPPEHGTGIAGYRLADYLDQHGRHSRFDQIPPAGFWTAAARLKDIDAVNTLSYAAERRGLYHDAAQLRKVAVAQGNALAACCPPSASGRLSLVRPVVRSAGSMSKPGGTTWTAPRKS